MTSISTAMVSEMYPSRNTAISDVGTGTIPSALISCRFTWYEYDTSDTTKHSTPNT